MPRPTAQRVIDRQYLQPTPQTLGELVSHLKQQLGSAGYPLPTVLGAGCDGFAMILEGERIAPDGRRIGFQQFGQSTKLSIVDVLKQLWTAAPGFYRMIVLVVARDRPDVTDEPITAQQLTDLGAQGSSGLPAEMAAMRFSPAYEVRALVYEFVRDGSGASQVDPSGRIGIVAHLKNAGLLPSTVK